MPKRLTTEQFIQKAKQVHGNIYNYSLSDYKSRNNKIKIICYEHGEFEQRAANHLKGSGCKSCANKNKSFNYKLTNKDFILKAKEIHGDKYDYSLVYYKNSQTKVKIVCPEHGVFEQTPNNHLAKQGCYKCGRNRIVLSNKQNPTGWTYINWEKAAKKSENFDSFKVYIIKCWNDDEEFYKIGKTYRTVEKRFNKTKYMPYNYKIIKIVKGNAKYVCKLEKQLQKENKEFKYTPKIKFNGHSECFNNINYEKHI